MWVNQSFITSVEDHQTGAPDANKLDICFVSLRDNKPLRLTMKGSDGEVCHQS
jgi:hypothetical protein